MKTQHIVSFVVAALIIAGGSFYGGTIYAKSKIPARGNFAGGAGGTFVGRGAGGTRTGGGVMAGFASGKIISMDDKSITVEMSVPGGSNGTTASGSKVIFTSDGTKIYKMTEGAKTDLTTGTNVTVTGTPNSDGSITAETVQIRPDGMTMPMMGGFGGRGQGGQPSGQQNGTAPQAPTQQ